MTCDSLIDERILDEAIERYVAWREECDVVQDAYERWAHACSADAAWAFVEYQAALGREEQIAGVYADLMARVVRRPTPCAEPAREPLADDRRHRALFSCMLGERGLVRYVVGWVGVLAVSALLAAAILPMVRTPGL